MQLHPEGDEKGHDNPDSDVIQQEEQTLTARALGGLTKIPGIRVYGIKDPDSPRFARKGGVIVFEVKEVLAAPQVAKELAERGGTGVRAGCHCAQLGFKTVKGMLTY